MMKIGTSQRVALNRHGPELDAAERQRHAERHTQDHHRERPQDVEHRSDGHVAPAPEVAGDHPQHDREDRGHERGREADYERVSPAVEQTHHDVAAVGVGAQEELALVGGPDGDTVEAHDVRLLAVDHDGVRQMVLRRGGVSHVLGPQRRRQAGQNEQHEEDAEEDRHLVALEAAHPQPPRAHAMDVLSLGLLLPGGRALERPFECRLGGHQIACAPSLEGHPTPRGRRRSALPRGRDDYQTSTAT